MKFLQRNHMLLIIIGLGVALRCIGLLDAGFHHDELSALMRTRFEGFNELIQRGIRIDGHPAFTQVFLWLWYPLVGATPWLIKLPFLLAGVASIYYTHQVGERLFSRPTGFIAAAGMAVIQYGITYSQWARPYAFGLLAVLIASAALLRYHGTGRRSSLLLFAFVAAWAGYTHYFALLQVLIFTLLFWILVLNKRERLEVVAAGLLSFLCWLPHLNITLHHLNIGGIGDWLEAAPFGFGLQLINYVGHYSWLMAIPLIMGLLLSVYLPVRERNHWIKQGILIGAFVFPFLLAYYYSHLRSALLHEGTMVFAYPFFLLFVAGLWYQRNRGLQKLIAALVLILGSYTLVFERLHPWLNMRTEFNEPIEWYHAAKSTYARDGQRLEAFFDLRVDAVQWFQQNQVADFKGVHLFEAMKHDQWASKLQNADADALMLLVTAASSPEYLAVAQSSFPYIKEVYNYHTASCYLLERSPTGVESQRLLAVDHPVSNMKGKEYIDPLVYGDTLLAPYTYLVGTAEYSGDLVTSAKLVLDGSSDGGRYWRSVEVKSFDHGKSKDRTQAHLAVDLRDLVELGDPWQLKLYPWNPNRLDGVVRSLSMRLLPSNPVRYGLFKQIPDQSLVSITDGKVKTLLNFEVKI